MSGFGRAKSGEKAGHEVLSKPLETDSRDSDYDDDDDHNLPSVVYPAHDSNDYDYDDANDYNDDGDNGVTKKNDKNHSTTDNVEFRELELEVISIWMNILKDCRPEFLCNPSR